MRFLIVLLVASAPLLPAAAQTPTAPAGGTDAEPLRWRVSANTGLQARGLSYVAALGVEREVAVLSLGRLSLGARGWLTTGALPVDDGDGLRGAAAEAQLTASAATHAIDPSAFAAVGLGRFDYYSGTVCEPESGDVCGDGFDSGGFDGVAPYVAVGVGLDVYPVPHVGLGVEVRAGTSQPLSGLVSAELGLRVRLPR